LKFELFQPNNNFSTKTAMNTSHSDQNDHGHDAMYYSDTSAPNTEYRQNYAGNAGHRHKPLYNENSFDKDLVKEIKEEKRISDLEKLSDLEKHLTNDVKPIMRSEYDTKFMPSSAYVMLDDHTFKAERYLDKHDHVDKNKDYQSEMKERNEDAAFYKARSEEG